MDLSSGLARRRNPHSQSHPRRSGSLAAYDPDAEEAPDSDSLASPSRSARPRLSPATNPAGVRSYHVPDPDHPVAFDPRDLDSSPLPDQPRPPRLTIMEEVLLLGIKDSAGYLSFWNDSISYALRGAVLLELALRGRIAIVPDPLRYEFPVHERAIEIVSRQPTGEVLLDETLQHMALYEANKASQGSRKRKTSVQWTDVLAGETWDFKQITYQLPAVRERLAKGLVDKGVLRTERSTFLFFDMATHPLADVAVKQAVIRRVHSILTPNTTTSHDPSRAAYLDPDALYGEERHPVALRVTRALCTVCTALAANVLENALVNLNFTRREAAFERADALIAELGQWPMAPTITLAQMDDPIRPPPLDSLSRSSSQMINGEKPRRTRLMPASLAGGSSTQRETNEQDGARATPALAALVGLVQEEMRAAGGRGADPQFEAIAGILGALAQMDCLI